MIAKYVFCDADRRFPVDIVVAYDESTSLPKDETCRDAAKEATIVTSTFALLPGMKPIETRTTISKAMTTYAQSALMNFELLRLIASAAKTPQKKASIGGK